MTKHILNRFSFSFYNNSKSLNTEGSAKWWMSVTEHTGKRAS